MLAEIRHRRVKVKDPNNPGGYKYELRTYVSPVAKKTKKPQTPKWVSTIVKPKPKKKPGAKANKLRVTATEWALMELQKKRRDVNKEFDAFYKKYPYKKPKSVKPKKSATADVPCSNGRYAKCEAVVYTYPSGNRRIVTTEKVPAVKKPKKQSQGKKAR
jgi:hypothetical protein